ncbi:MAG TPA: formylglycine-generating enzyme family protein [Gammaproteobacteria bacterium]|nr:formylglycine-generating enzyme family protein [Gammaproteobacteria bacterium]
MIRRLLLATVFAAAAAAAEPVKVDGGEFATVLPPMPGTEVIRVEDFLLDRIPVSNEAFLAFVTRNPEWRRGMAKKLLVGEHYLEHWKGPLTLGDESLREQPVTNVSWFAARAYCESRGGRLPSWHEWEYAAAAGRDEFDARHRPEWRQRILDWYAQTGGKPLRKVGAMPPDVRGIHDLHGLIWEWVEDYNALMISGDNREQGGADEVMFCGAGAASMKDREHYAVLMRVAMLSSLKAGEGTRNLGFRCAYDPQGE